MDKLLASAKKKVLVEMVKFAQKRGMSGSEGQWKEFLKVHDKKFCLIDPSLKPVESLSDFLKTFTREDDLKFFKKVLQCQSNRDEVEQFKKTSPDNDTAEQRLIRSTLEHPRYQMDYSFPSHQEEWLIIKSSKKSKAKKSTALIAIDCEMVLCEDGTEALVKVCAVDHNLKVKLDEVVNPNKAIADYRTTITGISEKDLVGVTHSLEDVQRSLRKLLSRGTILVGHSLNNDLQALKLDHTRVIDTSFIFKYHNRPASRRPSLSSLCKSMLGYELREEGKPHNCLDDACAAMKLVLARLNGTIGDVFSEEVNELDMAKFLVHRIPVNVTTKDLQSIIPGEFTLELKVSKKVGPTYSAFAMFKSHHEANEAFEKLEGDLGKDSFGRSQKSVKIDLDSNNRGFFCVCKTIHEDTISQLTSKKRSVEDEDSLGTAKKLKADETSEHLVTSNQCETHVKEIERLRKELSQSYLEISSLNKIIAALTRKQGL